MHRVVVLRPDTGARHEVSAPVTAGGSRADGVLVPGAPAGALRLVPAAAGVVVEALAAGVRVAGHAVAPGTRRLLRPGERVELRGAAIALEPVPPPDGTRAAASPLLRGEVAGDGLAVVVLTGLRAGSRHAIGPALTIGRGRAAALRLPDPLASRVHLRLRAEGGAVTVEDLGSKNGVRVNGVALDRPSSLAPGDEIAVGDTVLALVDPWRDGGASPADAPPARGPRRLPPRYAAALLLALSAAALALSAP